MERTSRERARAIWRELADLNQWQLFPDEEALLDEALPPSPEAADAPDARLRATLQRAYSLRLHRGIVAREERAAVELWQMFTRLALRDGATQHDAGDLAQEAVARVLAKLGQVTTPGGFLAWAMMVFRTAQRDLRPKRAEQALADQGDTPSAEPADPADMAAEVEARLVEQEFRELLRAAVPNALERLTLLRCVVLDDDPRDVARDLGLPLYRTRVAKARALQRLRGDDACMAFIASLGAPRPGAASDAGGQPDA